MMQQLVKDNFHVFVLLGLLFVLLGLAMWFVHRGMNPESMGWAKEQISGVLGAILYSLKPGGVDKKAD